MSSLISYIYGIYLSHDTPKKIFGQNGNEIKDLEHLK